MSEENNTIEKPESLFLNEGLMAAVAGVIAVGGFISLFFFRTEMDPFEKFGLLIKLLTAVAIYFTFRSYNWDVTKGLLGGVLFSLMYLEAYLVFAKLWSQDFDTYLVAGVAGSIDASSMLPQEILPGDQTVVYNTGPLYVIFPEYSDIDHVVENRPSQSDDSITWCSGAAFQHTVSLGFSEEDVEGDHARNGSLFESPYNREDFVAFTFADGKYAFHFENTSEAMKEAAAAGGSGFMQFGLIRDGKSVMNFDRPRARSYRTLAELNGNLCIIDSVKMMHFTEFMEELQKIGVSNAIYMDMGAGWNYSWYRQASGKVLELFGFSVPWSHNWVVFRK